MVLFGSTAASLSFNKKIVENFKSKIIIFLNIIKLLFTIHRTEDDDDVEEEEDLQMALIGLSCFKFFIYYLLLVSTKLMISFLLLKDTLAHVNLEQ